MRNFGISSPRIVATGESNQSAGSRDAGTQYNPHIDNVIRFPALTSKPDNSELLSSAPLSFDHDRVAGIALTIVLGFVLLAAGLVVFAGDLLFGLFDLG